MRAALWGLALVCCVTWLSQDALAKPPRKKKQVIALFPLLVKGQPPAELVHAIDAALERTVKNVTAAQVVAGKELSKRLRTDVHAAVEACGDNPDCVLQLGNKLGASEVLLGRARAEASGVRVIFAALDTHTGAMLRKLSVDVVELREVDPVIEGGVYTLLGIHDLGTLVVENAQPDAAVELDGESLGIGPGSYPASPGRHSVSVGGITTLLVVHPNKATYVKGAETPAAQDLAQVMPLEPITTTPSAAANAETTPRPADSTFSNVGFYTGVGVAAAGVVALGLGSVFGIQAQNAAASVTDQTSLPMTLQAEEDIRGHSVRATWFFVVGGIMTAAGAALATMPWWWPSESTSVTVMPERDGASVWVRW